MKLFIYFTLVYDDGKIKTRVKKYEEKKKCFLGLFSCSLLLFSNFPIKKIKLILFLSPLCCTEQSVKKGGVVAQGHALLEVHKVTLLLFVFYFSTLSSMSNNEAVSFAILVLVL